MPDRPAPTVVEHRLPPGVRPGPVELSIVVPALNESITVGEFVDWCHQGLARAGVSGQILIVDSSTDDTPEIALARGAMPFVRGKWIVMGDADLTYDFRELAPFVEAFRNGAEFVMGSRFSGTIESGAMPPLHQYFGTPFTTWILNRIYGSRYSDIHCGMRGATREALARIGLRSPSWEYASEMVLKAARLGLRVTEVPVRFYKDRKGRLSHHRRMGWLSPWIAGWLNLEVMLVYSPDSFLLKPGTAMMAAGLLVSLTLGILGPITIGGIGINLHWMLLGVTCATLGYSCIQIGIVARIMHGLHAGIEASVRRTLTYNRGMAAAAACVLGGLLLDAGFALHYVHSGLRLEEISYGGILGLLLVILGFQTFAFTLLLEMASRVIERRDRP
jgi:Glycosyl transferase family 2